MPERGASWIDRAPGCWLADSVEVLYEALALSSLILSHNICIPLLYLSCRDSPDSLPPYEPTNNLFLSASRSNSAPKVHIRTPTLVHLLLTSHRLKVLHYPPQLSVWSFLLPSPPFLSIDSQVLLSTYQSLRTPSNRVSYTMASRPQNVGIKALEIYFPN